MSTRFDRRFKSVIGSIATVFGLMMAQDTQAQLAYVPKNVTVIAGPGANFGGADTAQSAALRGMGQAYQGQGAYLQGLGSYLQGVGQYQKDQQTVISLAMQNRAQYLTLHRAHKQQLEQDRQTSLALSRARNEAARLARLRDQPSETTVASGQSLNFLWDRLGNRVEALVKPGAGLNNLDISAIRFQTARGASLETLLATIDADGGIQWPAELRHSDLTDIRRGLEAAVRNAHQAAMAGQPATEHYHGALRLVPALHSKAHARNARQGFAAWKNATTFCESLRQTLLLGSSGELERVKSVLTHQPKNLPDLVRHMRTNNLRFAATSEGTGATYHQLHVALAELDASTSRGPQLAGR